MTKADRIAALEAAATSAIFSLGETAGEPADIARRVLRAALAGRPAPGVVAWGIVVHGPIDEFGRRRQPAGVIFFASEAAAIKYKVTREDLGVYAPIVRIWEPGKAGQK